MVLIMPPLEQSAALSQCTDVCMAVTDVFSSCLCSTYRDEVSTTWLLMHVLISRVLARLAMTLLDSARFRVVSQKQAESSEDGSPKEL